VKESGIEFIGEERFIFHHLMKRKVYKSVCAYILQAKCPKAQTLNKDSITEFDTKVFVLLVNSDHRQSDAGDDSLLESLPANRPKGVS